MRDEPNRHASRGEHVRHAIDCVAFADAAGIELQARHAEAHRPGRMIQEDMAIADVPERGVDLAAIWQRAFTVVEAPHAHQRTDGDVEAPWLSAL